VETLLAAVHLRPVYAGGIPMKTQRWLRPLAVMATLGAGEAERPLSDLPLRIQASDRSPPVVVRTDGSGVGTMPIPKATPATTRWTVTLALDEMLGPGTKLACPTLTVQGRSTGLARASLVHVHGKKPAAETGRAVLEALKAHMTQPTEVPAAVARQLSEAGTGRMKEVAPQVAEQLRGAVDTILLLDAESEFASRMGTQRVWYEACGTLRVFDAWTGALLAEVSATVTEAGLGDDRAESAAQQALGRELAGKLTPKLGAQPPAP